MSVFKGETVDGHAKAQWPEIYRACEKHHWFVVEVRKYDELAEISEAQRKWLHCKNGPIRELMREGWSFRDAKEHCKVEWGRPWFVVELTDANYKRVEGVLRWECRKVTCRKLIHPMDIRTRYDGDSIRKLCPYCGQSDVKPIAIKSIMRVSVKHTNLWFKEIFAHFPRTEDGSPDGSPRIEQPDPAWNTKKNRRSDTCKNTHQ